MLGMKKEKVPFGQRKSNGAFGTKPSSGDFGKKPSSGSFGINISSGKFGTNSSPQKKAVLKKSLFTQHSSIKDKPISVGMFDKAKKTLNRKSKQNIVTAEEQEFMNWLHSEEQYFNYPCYVCGKFNPSDPIKWHHVKEFSSDKKNHKRQIPLCDNEHHRLGKELSPHGTPKKWRATYSMNTQNKYADSIWNDFIIYKSNALYIEN